MKKNKIWHPYWKWECYKAGFYSKPTISKEEGFIEYKNFFSDLILFENVLNKVITEWRYSCEHFLTNENINKIAWLGQASATYHLGIPAIFKGGFKLLSNEKKQSADNIAEKYLIKWYNRNEKKNRQLYFNMETPGVRK